MIISVYSMESAILRAEKLAESKSSAEVAVAMARIHAAAAFETLERSARIVIATVAEGDLARTQFAILRRLAKHDPADVIALRRTVAQHVIEAGKYGF
jgi:butyryl-CoA dehydrogenase